MADSGELVWNVDMEVGLFHAMRGHKPVGVNRHFQMIYIHNKINDSLGLSRKITSNEIWKQLSTLYQLQALNESEILPFPNKEIDFILPDDEYRELKHKRDFPRTIKVEPTDNVKGSPAVHSGKKEMKGGNTPQSKADSKSHSTPQTKDKHKDHLNSSLVDPSPKRKRTRQTNSAAASPATPNDTPPIKRRK
ncbi:hypothetical protein LOTGIDRAFT_213024 [Lottia gigantea]|uniref:MRG-binding protein n=1 Tax=Lottia gigantea TaxID=225164 RepID=V4A9A2_LOTGI|nr:hypothetical protein LOTGIDRAFT_213024 [Lottia gigantea]ESP00564.1 hypothetical protein LOTGIDRAFT_213024 [Lottia gigantea]